MNSASSGATTLTPNVIGTASRTSPRGVADCDSASLSAASPSASSRVARSASFCPASVSASRREVRLNSRAPSRASSRVTALETVAFDNASSAAAPAKERNSTTFANTANASKSGSLDIRASRAKMETMCFNSFCFFISVRALFKDLRLTRRRAAPRRPPQRPLAR